MITDDRARSIAFQVLAYLTSTGPAPDLDALDFWEAKAVAEKLRHISGRSVALVVDEGAGRVGFVFLDEILPKLDQTPDLEAALERWAAKEDGDDEEAGR